MSAKTRKITETPKLTPELLNTWKAECEDHLRAAIASKDKAEIEKWTAAWNLLNSTIL